MARINIEDCWWTDPRRSALQRMGLDADGVAVRTWRVAQDFWKRGQALVPKALYDTLEGAEEMIKVGLAEVRSDAFVYVRGSSAYLDWINEKRRQAKAAGLKSAAARREQTGSAQPRASKPRTKPERTPNEPRTEGNGAEPSLSSSSSFSSSFSDSNSKSLTGPLPRTRKPSSGEPKSNRAWEAYAEEFSHRWKTEPKRNAKINAQLCQLVDRIGEGDAPQVIRFFVRHNRVDYVKNMHPVGLALAHAEKLYAEWKTGSQVTTAQAQSADRMQNNVNVFADAFRAVRERDGNGAA